MIVGTINVRFYLLDVPYTRRYFRITPSHILGHSGMDASNIKILKKKNCFQSCPHNVCVMYIWLYQYPIKHPIKQYIVWLC